jgi:hypothetical protein
MTTKGDGSRPGAQRRGRMALLSACCVTAAVAMLADTTLSSRAAASSPAASADQPTAQRRAVDAVVSFEFEQTNATTDQITIVFTNTPVAAKAPSGPVFREDTVQEFSFSGRDYPKESVSFSRRVRDRSLLDCRFIRVVNHGSNRWFPSTISMTIDGQRILDRLSMYPRKGANPKGGIERWGEANATFWEADLQRFRPKGL